MVIVRGADQIPRVPFLDQFQHQPAREEGDIVGMWLDGSDHLPRMRLPRLSALNLNLRAGKRPVVGRLRRSQPAGLGTPKREDEVKLLRKWQ